VPIFGQEEDAADALSILLIDALYDPDVAEDMAYDSAAVFWAEAAEEPAFWDTHGPDEQRFYNTVCLFYGADPDRREAFAEDLGLPEERAEGCPGEFELAANSWNTVLDEMAEDKSLSGLLVFEGASENPLIEAEIAALNEEFRWPRDIVVESAPCGEANAYYDLGAQSITMCEELSAWLAEIAAQQQ